MLALADRVVCRAVQVRRHRPYLFYPCRHVIYLPPPEFSQGVQREKRASVSFSIEDCGGFMEGELSPKSPGISMINQKIILFVYCTASRYVLQIYLYHLNMMDNVIYSTCPL